MIMISACLCGENCKYDGGNNLNAELKELFDKGKAVTVCPEVMGGLSTPRSPSEIMADGRVVMKDGTDVTENFKKGALLSLKTAQKVKPTVVILKAKSPSCGVGKIYDGTFSKTLKCGNGICADMLIKNGFNVITENDDIQKYIKQENDNELD